MASLTTTLETRRLLLQPHRLNNFESYAALWAGAPEADKPPRQSLLGKLSEEEVWARLLRFIGHWETFGYGPFLAIERVTGDVVAEAGFAQFRRGIDEDFDGAPEAMWKVDDRRQGSGVASETMLSITHWFDMQRPEDRTVCMIHESNIASRRVADRLGFQQFGHSVYRENPVLLFERIKSNPSGT